MKKSIFTIVAAIIGCVAGAVTANKICSKKITKIEDNVHKMYEFYDILNRWLILKQEGKILTKYFNRNEYKTVAIYGMKELGERLYEELRNTEIQVKYIIDKNADGICAEIDVVTPDTKLEPVDVIVVTAVHYYEEIEKMLEDKIDFPVVSLEDIIYEME